MPVKRDIVLLIGNCQSRAIGTFFDRLPGFAERYETACFRNYQLGAIAGRKTKADAERKLLQDFVEANRSRIKLFIRQKTHDWFNDGLMESDFATGTDIIEFPACLLNYIWPMVPHGGYRFAGNRFQRNRFPFSILDSEVLRLKAEGVREAQLLDRYLEIDVVKKYRVDRLRRLNEVKATEIDARSTFPLWPFISDGMSTVQMFRTENHPNGPLLAEILRQIDMRTTIIYDRASFGRRVEAIRRSSGVGLVEAPVHPHIAAHFNLEWAEKRTFSFWGYVDLTFEEYLLRIYRLDADDDYWGALEAARQGDHATAIKLLDQAVQRTPSNLHFRNMRNKFRKHQNHYAYRAPANRNGDEHASTPEIRVHLKNSEEAGETAAVVEGFETILESDPNNRDVLRRLLDVFPSSPTYDIKRHLEIYNRLCRLDPADVALRKQKARVLADLGMEQEELFVRIEIVSLCPQDAGSWARIARAHQTAGRPAAAASAWRKVIELQPSVAARLRFASSVLTLHQTALGSEAEAECRRVLMDEPGNERARKLLTALRRGRERQKSFERTAPALPAVIRHAERPARLVQNVKEEKRVW